MLISSMASSVTWLLTAACGPSTSCSCRDCRSIRSCAPISCRSCPPRRTSTTSTSATRPPGRLLNTAGYRFNQTDLNNRDQLSLRFDYEFSQNHKFEGIFSRYSDADDRTDIDTISPDRPLVQVNSKAKHFVGAWRSTYGTSLINEVRAGGNLSPVAFNNLWDMSAGVLYNTVLNLTNPIGGFVSGGLPATAFQSQGRFTNTYQANDNATLVKATIRWEWEAAGSGTASTRTTMLASTLR
jgi:hypothetical protein